MLKITKLDNGLRVVTQNMPGLETVYMGIWNAVGGRDEVEANNGVAHLLEHMAFKGTLTKNALQIAETIEDVGGDINAYTSKEITAYYVKLLADDLHYGQTRRGPGSPQADKAPEVGPPLLVGAHPELIRARPVIRTVTRSWFFCHHRFILGWRTGR